MQNLFRLYQIQIRIQTVNNFFFKCTIYFRLDLISKIYFQKLNATRLEQPLGKPRLKCPESKTKSHYPLFSIFSHTSHRELLHSKCEGLLFIYCAALALSISVNMYLTSSEVHSWASRHLKFVWAYNGHFIFAFTFFFMEQPIDSSYFAPPPLSGTIHWL